LSGALAAPDTENRKKITHLCPCSGKAVPRLNPAPFLINLLRL
jgi:hypothetical protein